MKRDLLNDLFYELIENGFIYNEDENGLNMSYGEYLAISEDFENKLLNEILNIYDFETAADTLKEVVSNTIDDVRIFFDFSEYENFDYCINYDENGFITYEVWDIPDLLSDHFQNLLNDTYGYELVA